MRIVGGEFRNRRLFSPKGQDVRPTGERVREAIFNILYARMDLEGKVVADICCGTGALGLEAVSRGAAHCTFIDLDTKPVLQNINELGVSDRVSVIRSLGQKAKIAKKADLVFLDPPYYKGIADEVMKSAEKVAVSGSVWFVEVEKQYELAIDEKVFEEIDCRRYGHSKIYILEMK